MAREQVVDVVGVFGDLDRARGAVHRMEERGIEAGLIDLVGPAVDKAATRPVVLQRDRRVVNLVGAHAVIGGVAGVLAGMIVAIIVAVAGPSGPAVVYVLAGVIFGGTAGLTIAAYASLDAQPNWDVTFEGDRGRVEVVVHCPDETTAEQADSALHAAGPDRVERR